MFAVIRSSLAVLMAALAMLAPAAAMAQGIPTVDCAVGYQGGQLALVVITFGSQENASGIKSDGSACTQFIQSGNWVGADKFRNWETEGYWRLCAVEFTNGQNAIVHVSPDQTSETIGYQMCKAGQDVHYFTGADMTNPNPLPFNPYD